MRYYSDETRKFYETEEDCKKAEETLALERKKQEEVALQKSAARKEAAKKVEDAYKDLLNAKKIYNEELNAFCKEYGSFHMTLNKDNMLDWFDSFWNTWF